MMRIKANMAAAGALLLAAWLAVPERAAGWGQGGHRVVANIAYDRLDATLRASVVAVLRKHEDFKARFKAEMPDDIQDASADEQDRWIFLQAAIWPDLIRSIPRYHKETYHFINLPLFLSATDQLALQQVIKPNVNLQLPDPSSATERDHLNCVQAFKLCVRGLTDADATDAERAVHYCWLIHIVGDVHQPLHSTCLVSRGRFHTAAGDRGGNGIKIKQGKNLHSFWDGLLGGEQKLNDIRGRAADLLNSNEQKKAAEKAAGELDIETWVAESHKLAKEFAYDSLILNEVAARDSDPSQPLQHVDLPGSYRRDAGQHAQRRVAEAGYRLAEILKRVAD